jgi:long-chain acyl-CoA synthetase
LSEIDRAAEGRTVTRTFVETSRARAGDPALHRKVGEQWTATTWGEYADRAARLAAGLKSLGVRRGERVVLMMRNRPEFSICDTATLLAGATPFSIYNSSAPEQVSYIAGHAEAVVAVVEDPGFLERFLKVRDELPALREIVVVEDPEGLNDATRLGDLMGEEPVDLDAAADESDPEDLLTLVYTSGTTGPPKGAMISHRNICWTHESFDRRLGDKAWLKTGDYLSYLPLAHVLERWYSYYYPIRHGYPVWCCPDVALFAAYLRDVRPATLIGVPRVWEKLRAGIESALAAKPEQREAFEGAMKAGYDAEGYLERGEAVPADVEQRREEADRMLGAVRAMVGVDRVQAGGIGAAPSPPDLIRFFRALGVPLSEGFGMTETSFIASMDTDAPRMGTAGRIVPGMEARLADDGELMLRGGNIITGYFKDPERTAETFDADGWLHTGDIAEMDADGYLKIVDRKKELIITAGGKNISPANIESALKSFPLIGQACAIGDGRPFVSALLVLDTEVAPAWAAARRIQAASLAELSADPAVRAEVERCVGEVNKRFSRVEQVKRFTILPAEWLPDSDELTPTMKLKRRGIHARYAEEIESLYT